MDFLYRSLGLLRAKLVYRLFKLAFCALPDLDEQFFGLGVISNPDQVFVGRARKTLPSLASPDGPNRTRRSSGLAVWMALRAHGWRTIRATVKSNIELTRMLEALLAERGFRVLEGGEAAITANNQEDRILLNLTRR